jgi:hypothetical protein
MVRSALSQECCAAIFIDGSLDGEDTQTWFAGAFCPKHVLSRESGRTLVSIFKPAV